VQRPRSSRADQANPVVGAPLARDRGAALAMTKIPGSGVAMRIILSLLCFLTTFETARAGTSSSDLLSGLPPVVNDTTKPPDCTVTYLVTNVATNDTIAVRMQIAPDQNATPVNNVMPCPPDVPPRVASRALDACTRRAAEPKHCVFADMGRDFEKHPSLDNTAENNSRCASDKATDIGLACWRSGELEVCDVGCGNGGAAAIAAAVQRCEAKQQRQCPITGSLPVLAPR
jgi:hypothetical protein